jgi:menaquinone-dependent protoporphyrinogen IX oxidase
MSHAEADATNEENYVFSKRVVVVSLRGMTKRVLIIVPESHGYPHAAARAIAQRIRSGHHRVDINDVEGSPPPDEYDCVLLGAEANRQRDRRLVGDYIASNRHKLELKATGLFLLCSSRATRANPRSSVEMFETQVGWRARFAAAFLCDRIGLARGFVRQLLLSVLRTIDGAVTDRSAKELAALAEAVVREDRRLHSRASVA